MDFLQKATDKLDIQDKLPSQVRDKIPGGQAKGKHAEGSHLSHATESHDDGAGFPQGLRPSDWMGDLTSKNLFPATAAVTEFRYPGSHDAATYGSGLESFSYQCQDKNLYDQMMTGQRAFDLRLARDGKKFIPVHGIAKNTADDFNQGPNEAQKNDLASQIMRFAKEHPKEIVIFQIRVEEMVKSKDEFADAVWNLLGERLLEAPERGGRTPTYQEAVESHHNVILGMSTNFKGHKIDRYVWDMGRDTHCWIGDGDQLLWNEPTWQSGEVRKVVNSTEEFMRKNEHKTSQRDKFWVAFLQLTPVLGQSIGTFIKEGGSVRPKDLALGGGLGTHGEFKGSNKELRDSGVFKSPIWKKNASCVMYDFCDTHTTGQIVAMNLDAGASAEGGAGRPGAREEEHDEAGRGGRGGRGGGRGGRGAHQEGPESRDDDDHDGPGGRGGHRGGRGGRGEHRGGRGGD